MKDKNNTKPLNNKRINDIDNIIDSIKTQKSYEKDLEKKSDIYKQKYPDLLEGYQLVKNKKELQKCKNAGYIRYINVNGEIRYGGTLLKISNPPNNDQITLLLLKNSTNSIWSITWEKNTIFYKDQVKKGDNLRNLFITLIDD
tara:strand:+ start:279 stop:707 length:429 start_codon:yes stop_codon:yes gene_type:complete